MSTVTKFYLLAVDSVGFLDAIVAECAWPALTSVCRCAAADGGCDGGGDGGNAAAAAAGGGGGAAAAVV